MPTMPTQRVPDPSETDAPAPRIYEARSSSGHRMLVEVWPDGVEVKMRIGDRWSAPFEIAEVA